MHQNNTVAGERPAPDSERDNYFARAQMYGCVLSGALAGHVHGTAAYDITTDGEPPGARPYFWQALRYQSGGYMRGLRDFLLSEGPRYRDLLLASDDLVPRKAEGSPERGLEVCSFMMRTGYKDLGFLYFEKNARRARTVGWNAHASYGLTWYNPRSGEWGETVSLKADPQGRMQLPAFPGSGDVAEADWAAKIVVRKEGE
jgi:hypothetical protein